MTNFIIKFYNKFKKQEPGKVALVNPKANNRNLILVDPVILSLPVKANIYCSDQVVVVGEGIVTGNIYAESCVVSGKVKGNIYCSSFIELKDNATVLGNLESGTIKIGADSVINGFVNTQKKMKISYIPGEIEEDIYLIIPDVKLSLLKRRKVTKSA